MSDEMEITPDDVAVVDLGAESRVAELEAEMARLDEAHKDWHERKLESDMAFREQGKAIRAQKERVRSAIAVEKMSPGERAQLMQRAEMAQALAGGDETTED